MDDDKRNLVLIETEERRILRSKLHSMMFINFWSSAIRLTSQAAFA